MPISFFSVRNIEELDFNKLVRQLPPVGSGANVRRAYVRTILESQDLLKRYGIDNPNRLAHFLGQGVVETGWLTKTVEGLHYSAERLRQIWPSRFRTDEIAREYARQPERIANFVYSNRLGNGPPESGDGYTFRGRGFFQLTGRRNYRIFGEVAGFDLENNPTQLEDMKASLEVAAAYFQKLGLGAHADADNAAAVSRGVNLGDPSASTPAHAEADRVLWTSRALDLVKDPQALLARASEEAELRLGATGDRVRGLQRDLADLGYPVGPIDGVFGPATRRAIVNFQEERRLPTTGTLDAATRAALDAALAPAPLVEPTDASPQPEQAQPQPEAAPSPPSADVAAQTDAAPSEPPQPAATSNEAPSAEAPANESTPAMQQAEPESEPAGTSSAVELNDPPPAQTPSESAEATAVPNATPAAEQPSPTPG